MQKPCQSPRFPSLKSANDAASYMPKFPSWLRQAVAAAALTLAAGQACTLTAYSPNGKHVGQSDKADAGTDNIPDGSDGSSPILPDGGRLVDAGGHDSGFEHDGGLDAGRLADAGDAGSDHHDAGDHRHDAGGEEHDAGGGSHDAGGTHHDAGGSRDAGGGGRDAGGEDYDAGGESHDAGSEGGDAGAEPTTDGGQGADAGIGHDGGASHDGGHPVCPLQPCVIGTGECLSAGGVTCDANGHVTGCDAPIIQPGPQDTCGDNRDNDCDGVTDKDCECLAGETQRCYTGATETRGVGTCHDGSNPCNGATNHWSPVCADEKTPTAEVCDGLDNNCNGETDEPCGIGNPCAEGNGICRREGAIALHGSADGGVGCDAVPGEPLPFEICDDGADNDCNGDVDNGCECPVGSSSPCYEGDPATRGVGICQDGAQSCPDGHPSGVCENQILPTTESCNDADDNCNGTKDEGCGLGDPCSAGLGPCRTEGVMVLNGQGGTKCNAVPNLPAESPDEVTCDGVDGDCDGVTDETYTTKGDVCERGVGACHSVGNIVCDGVNGPVCTAPVITPTTEQCGDGVDNDCNGQTDEEGATGCIPLFRDHDVDSYGTSESKCLCAAAGEFTTRNTGDCADSDPLVNPGRPEIVNGKDDNCDGWIDEASGVQVMCEAGGNIQVSISPTVIQTHQCANSELVSVPAPADHHLIHQATMPVGTHGGIRRTARMVTLAPNGMPSYLSVRAFSTLDLREVGVGEISCPSSLPVAPAGQKKVCFDAPPSPSSLFPEHTEVQFQLQP